MYTNVTQDSMGVGKNYSICKAINKTVNYVKDLTTTLIRGAY